MIIDNLSIFSDNVAVAAGNSAVVQVMPFLGKGEPVYVSLTVSDEINNLTSLTVKLQQADTPTGAFADTGAGLTLSLAELQESKSFRFEIPDNAKKPCLRLNYTLAGTAPTAGTLFAAMARDGQNGYEAGQYLDKGKAVA